MINDIELRKLQELQLSLAIKVHDICKKHEISYFMIAGTLLGAVRHRGFIPWDDDLDIGMLREDYDRFIVLAQRELGDAYFLQTYETDKNMPFPYAKLRINGTIMRESASKNCKWNNGIFIDIFPFDGVPENKILRKAHAVALSCMGLTLIVKCEFDPFYNETASVKSRFFGVAKYLVKWLLPRKLLVAMFDFLTRFYSKKKTRLIVASGGSYGYKRETIQRRWVETTRPLEFCNYDLIGPYFFEDYLSNLYGDYMKLPPIESRFNRHGIVELRF